MKRVVPRPATGHARRKTRTASLPPQISRVTIAPPSGRNPIRVVPLARATRAHREATMATAAKGQAKAGKVLSAINLGDVLIDTVTIDAVNVNVHGHKV